MIGNNPSSRRVLWLLPLVFVLHDAEELLTIPGWAAAHREALAELASASPIAARVIGGLSTTSGGAAIAIGFIFAILLVGTAGASFSQRPRFWMYLYAALLGALFLHVFTHAGQAIFFGGYVPGLYGAVLAVLPGSLFLYRRLFSSGLLAPRTAAAAAVVGMACLAPVALAAHALGRWLSP